MADITKTMFLRHLRANPTAHVRHLRKGNLAHDGAGQAFWFRAMTAAISEVPVDRSLALTPTLRQHARPNSAACSANLDLTRSPSVKAPLLST